MDFSFYFTKEWLIIIKEYIEALENYKLQQSKNESLSKQDMWLAVRTIDECIQILKKGVANERETEETGGSISI